MGHLDAVFLVTPRNAPCRLRGFPTVSLVDGRGRLLPTREGHRALSAPHQVRTVQLRRGKPRDL